MYCKMCGNSLNDTDLVCKACGYVIEERNLPSQPKEEMVLNPSYNESNNEPEIRVRQAFPDSDQAGRPSSFAETEQAQQENDEMDDFDENDMEEKKSFIDTGEFSWNVHEFPRPKKTEDINFQWGEDPLASIKSNKAKAREEAARRVATEAAAGTPPFYIDGDTAVSEDAVTAVPIAIEPAADMMQKPAGAAVAETAERTKPPERDTSRDTIRYDKSKLTEHVLAVAQQARKEAQAQDDITGKALEKQLFADIIGKLPDSEVFAGGASDNRFFTFNKKNEEFQELLDREYEKIRQNAEYRYIDCEPVKSLEEIVNTPMGQGPGKDAMEQRYTISDLDLEFVLPPAQADMPAEEQLPEEEPIEGMEIENPVSYEPLAQGSEEIFPPEEALPEEALPYDEMTEDAAAELQASELNGIDRSYLDEMATARINFFSADSVAAAENTAAEQAVPQAQTAASMLQQDQEAELREKEALKRKYDTVEIMVNSSKPVKLEVAMSNSSDPHMVAIAQQEEIPITEVVEVHPPKPQERAGGTADAGSARKSVLEELSAPRHIEILPQEHEVPAAHYDLPLPSMHEEGTAEPQPSAAQVQENTSDPPGKTEKRAELPPLFEPYDDKEDKERLRGRVLKILLVVVIVLLAAELIFLGIKYLAPDSAAGKFILSRQTAVVTAVKGLFEGSEADEKENGAVTPASVTAPDQGPSIDPQKDKSVLIAKNKDRNQNIEEVKANGSLRFTEGRDYGVSDINHSMPITNNIWSTSETGEPVYFDSEIVGTIMAFDSQWTDYVNSGNRAVLDLLKPGSAANRNADGFSKLGEVKETFQRLEIGEIRKGETNYYVWCREEIQMEEGGRATPVTYNWIYSLEPVGDKLQIVNYYKF